MSDSFAARADAIFGTLGESGDRAEWNLDTAQGFRPGANDALDRDSSDDEAEEAEPQSLPGADDSDEEQEYRLRASKCYRQAFEREEEEDEYDRVATGHAADESRPMRSMEVLEDNAFDRMHSLVYNAAVSGTNGAGNTDLSASLSQQRQQPMEHDAELPPLEAPATAREHSQHEQQHCQDLKRHKRSQQVQTIQQRQADSRSHEIRVEDMQQPSSSQSHQQTNRPQQQQQRERRVHFAVGNAHQSAADDDQSSQRQQQRRHQGCGRGGGRGPGRGSGGRGRGFVPDHVRNPHKYTVYTLDEPIFVGQGDKDPDEVRRTQYQQKQQHMGGDSSSGNGRHRYNSRMQSADSQDMQQDVEARGRWQDNEDVQMATSDDARADGANDFPNSSAVDADPEAHKQLPPVGSIKFQPSSKRTKTHAAVGGAVGTLSDQPTQGSKGPADGAHSGPARGKQTHSCQGVYLQEHLKDADAEPVRMATSSTVRGKGDRHRQYRVRAVELS